MLNCRDLAVKVFAITKHLSLLAPTFATEGVSLPAQARRPSSTRGLLISSWTAAPGELLLSWELPEQRE